MAQKVWIWKIQTFNFCSLNKAQWCSTTAFSTVVTTLYIRPSDFIHLTATSLYPFTSFSLMPHLQQLSFCFQSPYICVFYYISVLKWAEIYIKWIQYRVGIAPPKPNTNMVAATTMFLLLLKSTFSWIKSFTPLTAMNP